MHVILDLGGAAQGRPAPLQMEHFPALQPDGRPPAPYLRGFLCPSQPLPPSKHAPHAHKLRVHPIPTSWFCRLGEHSSMKGVFGAVNWFYPFFLFSFTSFLHLPPHSSSLFFYCGESHHGLSLSVSAYLQWDRGARCPPRR